MYELDLPTHIKVHNVFHASLLKKYVYDTKHVIDWSLLLVEPERDFVHEPLSYSGQKRSTSEEVNHHTTESEMEALWSR